MEREECKPKSWPTNLLKKDWCKRRCYYSKEGISFMEKVHNMEVRDDDVWVVTLPKSGTTWMQELVWLVLNDFDFQTAKSEHLEVRTPFLEFDFMFYGDLERALKPIDDLKIPRLIKSHQPLPLLPAQLWSKKPKVIYVYRNPKDAMVSKFYHSRSLGFELDKSLEAYLIEYMENGSKTHLPFEHVTEFYALRHEPWLFYTSFERMKENLREVIENICKFLNKAITEEQMQQMLHHLSFEEMSVNPKTNHHWEFDQVRRIYNTQYYEPHNFVRKGKVGGHKDDLSPEFIAKLDNWIEQELSGYNISLDELLLLNNCENNDNAN